MDYALFRPFNWIGPKLDDVMGRRRAPRGSSPSSSSNVIFEAISLSTGQAGSVVHVHRRRGRRALRIISAGRPLLPADLPASATPATAWASRLAKLIIAAFRQFPEYRSRPPARARTVVVSSGKYFGKYYQDIQRRALGGRHPQAARLEAEGRPQDRDQAHARLPGPQGLQARSQAMPADLRSRLARIQDRGTRVRVASLAADCAEFGAPACFLSSRLGPDQTGRAVSQC